MIRFKTIEPGEAEKPAVKLAVPTPAIAMPEPAADDDEPAVKPKGMTRKTPLRAKKPEAARLFDK